LLLLGRLPRRFDEFDVLLQQLIDELPNLDAAGLGPRREISLHLGIEVHRQIDRCAWLEKLSACTLGEVDLGGHVVLRAGLSSHGGHLLPLAADRADDVAAHRGSFSYCQRSLRLASRAEMIRTLAVSGPVAV